ncbi:alcohol dehydrogenase [Amycolatopsis sp. NBRC 101858]|uniref:alcohol dehydrogenase catalytic domain-containing protein n=1 Tax=Amycolatopsis sp. NBRC 101858 TaxID=3032200 RepID=UPI0024A5626F|nr:alcohol dehydrogenase catalytic domain-containing protein [Amycolatopsis sp. NBRC 101858]GLY35334.1 alcohol dehydrogenase [Amycolatopsis sp. NBRC 101858]
MRAVVMEEFRVPPVLRDVPEPVAPPGGAVIEVDATGVCRSDWHTWQGHDAAVRLPHVAGHELAGRVVALGAGVRGWELGARVTVPFVCACGTCSQCARGDQQICDREFQPGATHWGSFAERVAIEHAETNLVALPDSLGAAEAAALGCRFGTAFRAVLRQGRVTAGQWVSVYGCGGVGISAVLLAVAAGAKVVAIDVSPLALALAAKSGATLTVDSLAFDGPEAVAAHVRELTGGGTHVSLDCLGAPSTCAASVGSLRKRGRHVQAGLMPPAQGVAPIPMHRVIGGELELVGIHGLQAHEYPELLRVVETAGIDLAALIGRRIGLDDVPAALAAMNDPVPARPGVTVVTFRD